MDPAKICAICFANADRSCDICQNAHYCSREHQLQDYLLHKDICNKDFDILQCSALEHNDPSSLQIDELGSYLLTEDWCQNNLPCPRPELSLIPSLPSFDAVAQPVEKPPSECPLITDDLFSSFTSEFLSSDNNLWDLINNCEAVDRLLEDGNFLEKPEELPRLQDVPKPQPEAILSNKVLNLMGGASLHAVCSNVVNDLNKYGICVLDKFVGEQLGNLILGEVKNLYSTGVFRKGELVTPNPYLVKESIRSDVTTWVNGTETECMCIGHLMQVLDVVMTTCNKFQNDGDLSKYKLHRRTKAMIACYPGDGTHYKKHIDNPHKDGRCVTCIYYLNQNWNTEKDGGMLRMFPSIMEDDVAQIEPIFDRMIFFWSDKRNPHEVLKAFRTRFAITVWYFDADERDRALLKSRELQAQAAR